MRSLFILNRLENVRLSELSRVTASIIGLTPWWTTLVNTRESSLAHSYLHKRAAATDIRAAGRWWMVFIVPESAIDPKKVNILATFVYSSVISYGLERPWRQQGHLTISSHQFAWFQPTFSECVASAPLFRSSYWKRASPVPPVHLSYVNSLRPH